MLSWKKINSLKCGDNKDPVATFVATLAIRLDNTALETPAINLINFFCPLFVYKILLQKLQSWNVTRESCVIRFHTKKAHVKCWWNWHLSFLWNVTPIFASLCLFRLEREDWHFYHTFAAGYQITTICFQITSPRQISISCDDNIFSRLKWNLTGIDFC